jgi:hypothetical protein
MKPNAAEPGGRAGRERGAPARGWWGLVPALLLLLLAACTRTTMPLPGNMSAPVDNTQVLEPTIAWATVGTASDELAVVWVEQGQTLPVRETAGIAGAALGELASTQRSLRATGNTTALGSSHWIEVSTPIGLIGWVPATSLTEFVSEESFCSDPNVLVLLDELRRVIADEDADGLLRLISPKRDFILRLDFWNEEVRIAPDQMVGIFDDNRSYQWGTRFASQTPIQGSFNEVIVPALSEVLDSDPQRACNELLQGTSVAPVGWPDLYANLNYYSLLRRPSQGGNPFNWRTWVIAFEYIEGRPYLALLVQLRPQV